MSTYVQAVQASTCWPRCVHYYGYGVSVCPPQLPCDVCHCLQVGLEPLLQRLGCWSFDARTEHTWTLIHSDAILSTLKPFCYPAFKFSTSDRYHTPKSFKPRDWPLTKQGLADLTTVMQHLHEECAHWHEGSIDLSSGCTWPERDVSVYEEWAKQHGGSFEKGWKVASSAPYNVIQALSAGLQAVEGHKKPKLTIVDV